MQANDIPDKLLKYFAQDAGGSFVRDIPVDSQIGIVNGAASYETGFPPLNFLPIGAGGIPPFGQDVNGILRDVTRWTQWQNLGGPVPFDPALSAAIGGYPEGTMVASAVTLGLCWLSTADDNVTDPDAAGAGWLPFYITTPTGVTAATYKRTTLTVRADGRISAASSGLPPDQVFLTAPNAFFTVPVGCVRIKGRMWAGGGGGGGSGSPAGGNGQVGVLSTFGSISAQPGFGGFTNAGQIGGAAGAGGTGGGGGGYFRQNGAQGQSGVNGTAQNIVLVRAPGGAGPFGGISLNTVGPNNSGAGGAGGQSGGSATYANGGGGGSSEYVEFQIISPVDPIAYQVGVGGAGGVAGPSGFGAADGASGGILLELFYD